MSFHEELTALCLRQFEARQARLRARTTEEYWAAEAAEREAQLAYTLRKHYG